MRYKIKKVAMRRFIKSKAFALRMFSSLFLILVTFHFVLLTFNLNEVNAQQTVSFPKQYLSISPIISDINIIPGKTTSFEITVQNLANAPLGIHADISNLDEPDSEDIGADLSPLTKWTKLSENNFIVDAKGKRSIKVMINLPKGIKEGGFYEVIYFTPFVAGQNQAEKPVVLSRIGSLVFATHGKLNYKELKQKVEISRFSPEQFFQQEGDYKINLEVENNYFTHLTAKPFINIAKVLGSAEKISIEEKRILPGRVRSWEIAGHAQEWGIYRADLALSVGSGEQIFATTWFVNFPINVLLVCIVILLITLFVIFRKKRLEKALKILAGKS